MNSVLVEGLLLAFAIVVILMRPYMRLLQWLGFGKHIRAEEPEAHTGKEGTPTMGGLLLIGVVIVLALALNIYDASTYAPLAALGGVGVLGAADDYLNARRGEGITARQKLLWQTVVAIAAAIYLQRHYDLTGFRVPIVGDFYVGPLIWVIVAAFAIISASNGVNITDGLDGLAAGTLVFSYIAYLIIALLNVPNQTNLAILCTIMIGALLGFLWFNVHPAQIFLGDAGSLSFGAALAVTALITGQVLILPIIGIIFVIETGSVALQIVAVKTVGRRIFRWTPIHGQFELSGWDEEKITLRFWIVAALAAMLGVVFFLSSLHMLQ
ncbi:MAG TPA: phospho-N-acetylmuramoyl-pentapeptide-transferase [Candidatus Acidoferrales bacterium]|nr:phospho-N-acetylmuramoyl-pentapeptide-transferase [Candidatus Acidoferrales bacterium]